MSSGSNKDKEQMAGGSSKLLSDAMRDMVARQQEQIGGLSERVGGLDAKFDRMLAMMEELHMGSNRQPRAPEAPNQNRLQMEPVLPRARYMPPRMVPHQQERVRDGRVEDVEDDNEHWDESEGYEYEQEHEEPVIPYRNWRGFEQERGYRPARDLRGGGGRNRGFRGGGRNRGYRDRNPIDENIGNIKMNIPPFQGKIDPDAYLDWERKVELVFDCHNYSEEKKVKLAAVEFTDYALSWWDQLVYNKRKSGDRIETWEEMKEEMRKRFVPGYYYKDRYNRLQQLTQGNKSVEEYHKELEMALARAQVEEEPRVTMARFQNGLNREIHDIVEMYDHNDIDELLHRAIKAEKQVKRRSNSKFGSGSANYSTSKPNFQRRDGKTPWKQSSEGTKPRFSESKGTHPSFSKPGNSNSNNTLAASSGKKREITCFKCLGKGHYSSECPNKRAMIIRNGEIVSTDEEDVCEDIVEDCGDGFESEHDEQGPDGGITLSMVVRRALNLHVKEEDDRVEEQRDNLFHTICRVKNEGCLLIIDGGSCVNVASTTLVDKLALKCQKHDKPYRLQWLNGSGECKVTKQVVVPFKVGKYEDEIVFDVVPMTAGHLLLGRPWQFDRRAQHDGYTNKYSLERNGKKVILAPMTPKQVHEAQLQLAKSIESCNVRISEDEKKERMSGKNECSNEKKDPSEQKKEWKSEKNEKVSKANQ